MTYRGVLDAGVVVVSVALGLAVLSLPALVGAARRGRPRAATLLRADVCLLWIPTVVVASIGPWLFLAYFLLVPELFCLVLPAALLGSARSWPRRTGAAGALLYAGVGALALIPLGLDDPQPQYATLQPLCAGVCFAVAAAHLTYAIAAVRVARPAAAPGGRTVGA